MQGMYGSGLMHGTPHGAHRPCDMPGAEPEQTTEDPVARHDSGSGGRSSSQSNAGSLSDSDHRSLSDSHAGSLSDSHASSSASHQAATAPRGPMPSRHLSHDVAHGR